jgi:hypothetical protein
MILIIFTCFVVPCMRFVSLLKCVCLSDLCRLKWQCSLRLSWSGKTESDPTLPFKVRQKFSCKMQKSANGKFAQYAWFSAYQLKSQALDITVTVTVTGYLF